jgi:hypothetical protein
MKNDDGFDYLNDSYVIAWFFKGVARSGLCQRLEERKLRSLEEHPPLADLRPIHLPPTSSEL